MNFLHDCRRRLCQMGECNKCNSYSIHHVKSYSSWQQQKIQIVLLVRLRFALNYPASRLSGTVLSLSRPWFQSCVRLLLSPISTSRNGQPLWVPWPGGQGFTSDGYRYREFGKVRDSGCLPDYLRCLAVLISRFPVNSLPMQAYRIASMA